jgi:hypothetical protein
MLKVTTERNARIESVGEHVHWFKFCHADVTITFWNWRAHVYLYFHGELAQPEWVKFELHGKLWKVPKRNLKELMCRFPNTQVIPELSGK